MKDVITIHSYKQTDKRDSINRRIMEPITSYIPHEAALSLLLRTILGLLFLFQGIDKVFKLGIVKVANTFQYEMRPRKFPKWILLIVAVFTSYIELIGGILLITGLFKTYTLYLLGLDIMFVTMAFSMIYPLWDMKFILPRLILLAILLYLPPAWDKFSLDRLLFFY